MGYPIKTPRKNMEISNRDIPLTNRTIPSLPSLSSNMRLFFAAMVFCESRYIFSGAETPSIFSAFCRTVSTDRHRNNLAPVRAASSEMTLFLL